MLVEILFWFFASVLVVSALGVIMASAEIARMAANNQKRTSTNKPGLP